MASNLVATKGALMANKNKASKDSKKVAGKSLKEKRLAKKAKHASHGTTGSGSVDKTFGH